MISKTPSGFTITDLLVALLIAGILALISLPMSLRFINRSRQVEAQSNISDFIEKQSEHYTEQNQFAVTLEAIGVNVDGTSYYRYEVSTNGQSATIQANANSAMLPGMTGVVWVDQLVVKSKFCKGGWWSAPVCPPEFSR